jgi:hypothetical protein
MGTAAFKEFSRRYPGCRVVNPRCYTHDRHDVIVADVMVGDETAAVVAARMACDRNASLNRRWKCVEFITLQARASDLTIQEAEAAVAQLMCTPALAGRALDEAKAKRVVDLLMKEFGETPESKAAKKAADKQAAKDAEARSKEALEREAKMKQDAVTSNFGKPALIGDIPRPS